MTDDLAFKPEDDRYHPLSDDPYETETNWWSFNIPERKIGCWIHAPYYPNRQSVTWRIFAWDDEGYDPARMAYYRKVEEAPMPDRSEENTSELQSLMRISYAVFFLIQNTQTAQ